MVAHDRAGGFTLIEALVAMVLVCTVAGGLAHLGLAAMAQSAAVQREAVALWLAQSKLEELRACQWAFGESAIRLSDPALAVSPPDALSRDTSGYVDAFDRFGEPMVIGPAAMYHRRWAIALVNPTDEDTLLLQSCVLTHALSPGPMLADACVSTVRTRHRP